MQITLTLNDKKLTADVAPDTLLIDFVRSHGCLSVKFGAFIADQGAEQCGFCNPGFIMNALALFREKEYPTDEEIKEYLSGNLCRCSGYEGQLRGIQNFLAWKKAKKEAAE